MNFVRGRVTIVDENGRARTVWRAPRLDARGLIDKYKGVYMVKDIQIEKLSLCTTGRIAKFKVRNDESLVAEEYEEVASIPLPQDS